MPMATKIRAYVSEDLRRRLLCASLIGEATVAPSFARLRSFRLAVTGDGLSSCGWRDPQRGWAECGQKWQVGFFRWFGAKIS